MPRVTNRPTVASPSPRTQSTAQPAPQPQASTQGAWAARGSRTTPKPALLGPVTFETPATKPMGPAKLSSPTIAGVKVQSATVLAFEGLKGNNPLMTQTVDVRFGKLSHEQFTALHKEFGGLSQVKYDAARDYTAIDFLPPAMQALVNKDIDPGAPVTLKGTTRLNKAMGNQGAGDIVLGVSPNCHGTAWEMMRAFQGQSSSHVALLYGDAQMVGYEDTANFTALGTAPASAAASLLVGLEPGDVLAFKQGEYELLHSAVYVGGGLFFEKPDTEVDDGSETPWRLVTLEQSIAPIKDFLGDDPTVESYRPAAPLKSAAENFSAGEDGQRLEAWANTRGTPLGKPLVQELEVGLGGGIRGVHLSAVEVRRVEVGADGRGVIR